MLLHPLINNPKFSKELLDSSSEKIWNWLFIYLFIYAFLQVFRITAQQLESFDGPGGELH